MKRRELFRGIAIALVTPLAVKAVDVANRASPAVLGYARGASPNWLSTILYQFQRWLQGRPQPPLPPGAGRMGFVGGVDWASGKDSFVVCVYKGEEIPAQYISVGDGEEITKEAVQEGLARFRAAYGVEQTDFKPMSPWRKG